MSATKESAGTKPASNTIPAGNGAVSEKEARQVAESARETEWVMPSFVRELFLGKLHLDLIHPPPVQDPDEKKRAAEFHRKLYEFAKTIDGEAIERTGRVPDDVIDGLRRLGAFGIKIPKEYGGLGLSQRSYNKAISIIASFAIVYFRFPLRNFFFWMIFVTLMLPVEVRIIPTFKVVADLGSVALQLLVADDVEHRKARGATDRASPCG